MARKWLNITRRRKSIDGEWSLKSSNPVNLMDIASCLQTKRHSVLEESFPMMKEKGKSFK